MKNFIKKHRKYIILLAVMLVLVGCKNVMGPDKQVLEKYIIRLGDGFPWGKEGYGWFDTLIVWPFAQLFNIVAKYTGAFWSIIIVTILIDIVKFFGTIKSTISQQKMTALTPEVNRIKDKYRGREDRQSKMQESMEIQRLYEKNNINMMGSMLPMFLQLPLILAVYQAVQRADLIIRGTILGHPFLGTPAQGFKEGNWVYITIFLVMFICQAASMFLPQYLQNRKKSKVQKGQAAGPNPQGMMIFSLGMITILGFTWNIGMSIYWGISAFTRLIQTLYVNWKYIDSK